VSENPDGEVPYVVPFRQGLPRGKSTRFQAFGDPTLPLTRITLFADSPRADVGKGGGGWRADFPVSHNGGATRSRTPEEPEVESSKHQDDADIHRKSLPEPGSASEETQIYTDYDGDHRHPEMGGSDLSAHAGGKYHFEFSIIRSATPANWLARLATLTCSGSR
jgi:hypothetical protein